MFFRQRSSRIAMALFLVAYFVLTLLKHPLVEKVLPVIAGTFVLFFMTAAAAVFFSGQHKQDMPVPSKGRNNPQS